MIQNITPILFINGAEPVYNTDNPNIQHKTKRLSVRIV
jgi:hypothetical protein